MVFRATDAASREFARQAARKSPVGRNPSACGRSSWAKRSDALKAAHLAALKAEADPHKGGAGYAAAAANPQFMLERAIIQQREEAIAKGEVPPLFYWLIPYGAPQFVKQPGRRSRWRKLRQVPP
jgi:hypothetical protein